MVGEPTRRERSRRGESPGRALFALGLLAVFVLATLSAGGSYLFCVPMQRAMSTCCQAASDTDLSGKQASDTQSAVRAPCCEARAIANLPSGTAQAEGLEVPSAPVSLLPPALPSPPRIVHALAPREPPRSRRVLHDRSRAGPQLASERCVALRVLRC